MQNLQLRLRMAAESILDNESLRGGLTSEEASSALLNWGISCAEQMVFETADLDDESADDVIYPRMRALRKMLGAIKELVNLPGGSEKKQALLLEIFKYAQLVYGNLWHAPEQIGDKMWLIFLTGSDADLINGIRLMIEGTDTNQGEENVSFNT